MVLAESGSETFTISGCKRFLKRMFFVVIADESRNITRGTRSGSSSD